MVPYDLASRDLDVLGGILVFTGTRVPVRTILDFLDEGYSLEEFLDEFPTVDRSKAQELLDKLNAGEVDSAEIKTW